MEAQHIHKLKLTFRTIEPLSAQVAARFYSNLFSLAPELEKKFRNVDMATQGSMLLQALGIAVRGLERPDELRPVLASLGYRHSNYGVAADHYAVAIDALLTAFGDVLGGQFDSDLREIWRNLLSEVTALMIEGGRTLADQMSRGAHRNAVANETLDDYLARFLSDTRGETVQPGLPVEHFPTTVTIELIGDGRIDIAPLQSILDASLRGGIAHVCECGGQGKCTTCRVLVVEGLSNCLPRNQIEARMAQLQGFPSELRLACQTRVAGPVKVRRLVHDSTDVDDVLDSGRGAAGREMRLAVLFADIRGFTDFSEKNVPYDVIHALNRYFNTIGPAIDEHGGYIDKYLGDGIMALFGLNSNRTSHPCVDATNAALGMVSSLHDVNRYLSAHLNHEFQIGIGIHYGTVVVGEIGFKLKKQFTAIGDAVNVAARLESETKHCEARILISDSVRQELPEDVYSIGHSIQLALKGKSGLHQAHELLARRQ